MNQKLIIGCLELCDLPDLNIFDMEVRIDTGAKNSSVHVDNLVEFIQDGKPWVSFEIHPHIHNVEDVVECKAEVKSMRTIKSSNGATEKRHLITTNFKLSDEVWPIDITLTNRSDMNYLMLLGRTGMGDHILVDPSKTFALGNI